jgi:hypothetical protein
MSILSLVAKADPDGLYLGLIYLMSDGKRRGNEMTDYARVGAMRCRSPTRGKIGFLN